MNIPVTAFADDSQRQVVIRYALWSCRGSLGKIYWTLVQFKPVQTRGTLSP